VELRSVRIRFVEKRRDPSKVIGVPDVRTVLRAAVEGVGEVEVCGMRGALSLTTLPSRNPSPGPFPSALFWNMICMPMHIPRQGTPSFNR